MLTVARGGATEHSAQRLWRVRVVLLVARTWRPTVFVALRETEALLPGKSPIVVTNCSLSHAAICSATNVFVRWRGGGRKKRSKDP